jgi:hypothetical protein
MLEATYEWWQCRARDSTLAYIPHGRGIVSAATQLRFIVGVFSIFGGLNLVMTAVQLAIGMTPRVGLVVGGIAYLVAAWQLWRGAAVAHFVLAGLSILSVIACALAGWLMRDEAPLLSLLMFLVTAVMLVCAYLLLFSRQLRTELKSRRLMNHEAGRVAYQKYMSELDQP